MGQNCSRVLCCEFGSRDYDRNSYEELKDPMLQYHSDAQEKSLTSSSTRMGMPYDSHHLTIDTDDDHHDGQNLRVDIVESNETRQACLPPRFFKRLDEFIHTYNLRAHQTFQALDPQHKSRINHKEIIEGFRYIEFEVTDEEQEELRAWLMSLDDDACMTFKDFTLALKQRVSKNSPLSKQMPKDI